ncbi:Ankyrin-3 [Stylophora pistillata]|uniref:Ankyrin-3 n=1 Tax=Stylophora pistillata TaxID=50429 RepID=A0A2B4RX35_STYPI|nr:Ankyrin-3 [Stylophora pistillata]
MPSRTEDFGLVALETISTGVPVLVSSEIGIAKALLDLEDGKSVVVKSEKSEEWANRIRRLSEKTLEDRPTTALPLRDQYNKRLLNITAEQTFVKAKKAPRKASDTSDKTAKHTCTKERKPPGQGADQDTSNERRDNVKRGKEKDQSADPETSNETREQRQGNMEEVQTGGATANQKKKAIVDQLRFAERKVDVSEIESLPSHGICVDSKNIFDETPLMYAPKHGKVEAVQCLIIKGADPNSRDDRGRNSLYWASCGGGVGVIELLVSDLTDTEPRGTSGETPLMIAAEMGQVEAVQYLISKGADPASSDNFGWNSLHWASQCSHVDVIELLVSHMTDIVLRDTFGETPLMVAAKEVKELIWLQQTTPDGISLHWASRGDHVDVIELLVGHLTDTELRNGLGETPLMVTAKEGKLLVSHMSDIGSRGFLGETPLKVVAKEGKVEVVQCLISKGANPASSDDSGRNSLHWATVKGNKDIIDILLYYEVDIESKTEDGLNDGITPWT